MCCGCHKSGARRYRRPGCISQGNSVRENWEYGLQDLRCGGEDHLLWLLLRGDSKSENLRWATIWNSVREYFAKLFLRGVWQGRGWLRHFLSGRLLCSIVYHFWASNSCRLWDWSGVLFRSLVPSVRNKCVSVWRRGYPNNGSTDTFRWERWKQRWHGCHKLYCLEKNASLLPDLDCRQCLWISRLWSVRISALVPLCHRKQKAVWWLSRNPAPVQGWERCHVMSRRWCCLLPHPLLAWRLRQWRLPSGRGRWFSTSLSGNVLHESES